MKISVEGIVAGEVRFREVADLGEGPLKYGATEGPIAEAMDRIRRQFDKEFPIDPFSLNSVPETWPDLTYRFGSPME